jgi:hypothetical protein
MGAQPAKPRDALTASRQGPRARKAERGRAVPTRDESGGIEADRLQRECRGILANTRTAVNSRENRQTRVHRRYRGTLTLGESGVRRHTRELRIRAVPPPDSRRGRLPQAEAFRLNRASREQLPSTATRLHSAGAGECGGIEGHAVCLSTSIQFERAPRPAVPPRCGDESRRRAETHEPNREPSSRRAGGSLREDSNGPYCARLVRDGPAGARPDSRNRPVRH